MTDVIQLQQDPHPGTHHIRFRGDLLTVALALAEEEKGRAWLRTNIGHGITTKRETIHTVERAISPQAEDWFDIPMTRVDERNFRVTLPLHEPGRFEGKCFFLKEGEENPVWPEGGNLVLHVKTARACSANIIYNAFVRQFGPNKEKETVGEDPDRVLIEALEEKDYTVIPPSGKLRDLKKELDFIVGELGCRILLLLPIHPIPTTYARMGRFGSPYAALNFYSVAPGLASFDQYSTPLEQFIELVDGVHERGALIMLDIAINHTGWAANLHETHPEWLTRDSAGEIQVPGAWGVFWEDLTKLDYGHQELWRYMTDVFLTWCARGVDGFRCDAGYMIPLPAWRYIVASVRARYPETVFLLEGLGGGIDATRDILDKANFDWAYSELFQNYDRGQIEHYLPDAIKLTEAEGGMIHFAETHDNPRLAATSVRYAMMRTALCALFSVHGGFGFANGVEWFARDKINVHQATSLNWGAPDNQVARIRELNTLLKTHPVFFDGVELRLIQKGSGNHVVLLRHHPPTGKRVIVLVNLDMENQGLCAWDHGASGVETTRFRDLLHHEEVAATLRDAGREAVLPLDPGQVRCLTPDPRDAAPRDVALEDRFASPRRVVHQYLAAKVCEILVFLRGVKDVGDLRMKEEVEKLSRDPREYCLGLNPRGEERRVTLFRWPEDRRREVMVPPGYFLMVVARSRFRARLLQWERVLGCEDGLPMKDGSRFALFVPRGIPQKHRRVKLELSVYTPGDPRHVEGRLLFLSDPSDARVRTRFGRSYVVNRNLMMLGVNGRGGMLSAFAEWGKLASKYDALIAANLDPRRPEDRWIMLARCRVWLVFQDYSKELNLSCLESFTLREDSFGSWEYRIPVGRGRRVRLMAAVRMSRDRNGIRMIFHRRLADEQDGMLADPEKIRLIVRPDIEDRNFHHATKAYQGPESRWPGAVAADSDGFQFRPDPDRWLVMRTVPGTFTEKHEWLYGVERPLDAGRGLDTASDLFSPGWFSTSLRGGDEMEIRAGARETEDSFPATENTLWSLAPPRRDLSIEEGMRNALDAYIVDRAPFKSVIAGWPWFLDWGRDSLIFARGLVAAGRLEDAKAVVKLFAQYEENGTLPNMIKGRDAQNRNTSDAPLWFFAVCSDLLSTLNDAEFLEERCGDRSFREILFSMANAIIDGTPGGVRVDRDTGLIFSPAHFTWMDTNHPACSPRQGYPIEIQALWCNALRLLARIEKRGEGRKEKTAEIVDWGRRAAKVKASISLLFWLEEEGFLSDCLHALPGTPAADARPDNALRPNQLIAVTMGVVDDTVRARRILHNCEELLVPGAIRSLADRRLSSPLEIMGERSVFENPYHPYQGRYEGDEDSRRKPAYHNGTAWTWMFPSFCEAWALAYGREGRKTARSLLSSATRLINQGCIGHLPEIVDGDYPHTSRGCYAQAWGASELLRVWIKLG